MSQKLQLDKSNFKQITSHLIKTIRENQSQEFLSEQLQFNFNVVSRWETLQRNFYWNDFILLAQLKKWDIQAALKNVTHFDFSKFPDGHEILGHLLIPSTQNLLKNELSAQKLNRLAAGKSKLQFCDFLLIIERVFGRSERFLNHFLTETQKSVLKPHLNTKENYLISLDKEPDLALLLFALRLNSYKSLPLHSNSFLKKILKISENQVIEGLNHLEKIGAIHKKDSLYEAHIDFVDTGTKDPIISKKLNIHFRKKVNEAAEESLGKKKSKTLSSFLIYATHPELEEKMFDLCRKFFIDVRNLAAENQIPNPENVRYIGVDLFYPLETLD